MAIIKVKSPIFPITLPRCKKEIKVRPFLAGEYKAILDSLNMVTGEKEIDVKTLSLTVQQVLTNCILNEDFDFESLSFVDVEFLFLNLYARSANSQIDVVLTCGNIIEDKKCNSEFLVPIPISEITITENPISEKLDLGDGNFIILKEPSWSNWFRLCDIEDKDDELIISCIDSFVDPENVYVPYVDSTLEEMVELLNQLQASHLKHINDYIEHMSTVYWSKKVKCIKCEYEHEITLKGLRDFLA